MSHKSCLTRRKQQSNHPAGKDGQRRPRSTFAEKKRRGFDADEDVVILVLVSVNRVVEKRPKNAGAVQRKNDGPITGTAEWIRKIKDQISSNSLRQRWRKKTEHKLH